MFDFGSKYSASALRASAGIRGAQSLLGRKFIFNCIFSAIVGGLFGIIGSLIVNCTLVEISLSSFFAMYFGALFVSVGSVLIWRLTVNVSEESKPRRLQLLFFASMIVLSGLVCFILRNNWFVGLSTIVKISLYTLLGISIAFALTFSLVDLANYLAGYFYVTAARSLVESALQVHLVVGTAIVMGAIFGFIFGLMDIEDSSMYQMKLALLREEHYCYPIGATLGAAAGCGNEYLRQKVEISNRAWHTEFDDEI